MHAHARWVNWFGTDELGRDLLVRTSPADAYRLR